MTRTRASDEREELMSPTVIRVSLLSGSYHAHRWGEAQHAMAGPEWPPSVWRLLRAVAACWFEPGEPPCTTEDRDALLKALGKAAPPTMWLPRVSFGEVPCYQPVTKEVQRTVAGKKVSLREVNSRVLHFDHFAVLAEPAIFFEFDVDLPNYLRTALSKLLARMRYFGRAESRASSSVEDSGWKTPEGYYKVTPIGGRNPAAGSLRRPVLVPTKDFTAEDLWLARQAKSSQHSEEQHPLHLVEALIAAKKPVPDGTSWVQYELPRVAVVHELPRRAPANPPLERRPAAEVVFRLFRRVPIPIEDTVLLARDFRDQAVRQYEQATGGHSVLLSGREKDGGVARGHDHAYYLPRPSRPGGFLEQLVVHLPGGENGVEQELVGALLRVANLLRRDTYPVLVVPEEIRAVRAPATALVWESLTPFLGPLRHRRGREATEPWRQLVSALGPGFGEIEIRPRAAGSHIVTVLSHVYASSANGGARHYRITRRAGSCFQIRFAGPVQLLAAVGADAHFGLGQFVPSPESTAP